MDLNKIKILVTLANQKGGVAKSTITSLLANAIHYRTDLEVCICDIDRQQTIFKVREEELEWLDNGDLEPFGITDPDDLYPVRSYTGQKGVESFIKDYRNFLKDDYNIIFLDVPGSLDQDFITAVGLVDMLIVPANLNSDDLNSTFDMLEIVRDRIEPITNRVIPKFFLPSKIDTRTSVGKQIDNYKDAMPLEMLNTHFPHLPGLFGNIQTYTSYENLASDKDREKKKVVIDSLVEAFLEKVFVINDESE